MPAVGAKAKAATGGGIEARLRWLRLLAVTLLVVGAGASAPATAARFHPASVSSPQAARCPRADTVDTQTSVRSVVAAALRLIPTVYRARPPGTNVVAEHPRIVEVLSLDPQTPALPGARSWWRIAARRCGARVATASWLVAATFPESKVATPSTGVIFLVHLRRAGWRVWWRYR